MMKQLGIIFNKGAAVLDFSTTVEGLASTAQNLMVNIATSRGSDVVYPSKGTNLLLRALQGVIVSDNSAMHASNFAAVDSLFFNNANTPKDDTVNQLQVVKLQPATLTAAGLQLDLQAQNQAGDTLGVLGTANLTL